MPFIAEFSEEEQQRHNPNDRSQRRALDHRKQFHATDTGNHDHHAGNRSHRTSQWAGHKCEGTQLHNAESEFRRVWRHCLRCNCSPRQPPDFSRLQNKPVVFSQSEHSFSQFPLAMGSEISNFAPLVGTIVQLFSQRSSYALFPPALNLPPLRLRKKKHQSPLCKFCSKRDAKPVVCLLKLCPGLPTSMTTNPRLKPMTSVIGLGERHLLRHFLWC